MKKISTTLAHAKKLLEKRGWCKYQEEDLDGKLCAYGAMHKIGFGSWDREEQLIAIFRLANDIEYISDFNDAKGTTKRKVLAAFDKAIKLAKERKL